MRIRHQPGWKRVNMATYTHQDFASETPPPRIMGTEMEYMVPAEDGSSAVVASIVMMGTLRFGTKPEQQALANGGRLYKDYGDLIEYATPECLGPEQLVLAEMAGERIVKTCARLVMGAQHALYRRTGSYDNSGLKTVGYHQNLLTPPRLTDKRQARDAHVIGAYTASRVIWSGAGMLSSHYAFSQKAPDIYNAPPLDNYGSNEMLCIGGYGTRTTSQQKPLLSWSRRGTTNGMDAHAADWTRLELRHADAAHSPWARFMGIATASLVLRLLEHRPMFDQDVWDDVTLRNLGSSVLEMSNNTSMDRSYELASGKRTTVIALQKRLAEMSLELADRVSLPEDELFAAQEWVRVCDDLSVHVSPEDVAESDLRHRVEWAGRLHTLNRRQQRLGINGRVTRKNPHVAAVDLMWDRIHPIAPAEKYWRLSQADFYEDNDKEIDHLMRTPPRHTRAHVRGELLRNGFTVSSGSWDSVKSPSGHTQALPDPYAH